MTDRVYDTTDALHALRTERLLRSASGYIPAPITLANKDWPPDYAAVLDWRAQ